MLQMLILYANCDVIETINFQMAMFFWMGKITCIVQKQLLQCSEDCFWWIARTLIRALPYGTVWVDKANPFGVSGVANCCCKRMHRVFLLLRDENVFKMLLLLSKRLLFAILGLLISSLVTLLGCCSQRENWRRNGKTEWDGNWGKCQVCIIWGSGIKLPACPFFLFVCLLFI